MKTFGRLLLVATVALLPVLGACSPTPSQDGGEEASAPASQAPEQSEDLLEALMFRGG